MHQQFLLRGRCNLSVQTCSAGILFGLFFSCVDEALQEKIWQQEVEESLSFCSSLSHPSRPKHIDFLRITAPEDDLIDTPVSSPLPFVAQVSSYLFDCVRSVMRRGVFSG